MAIGKSALHSVPLDLVGSQNCEKGATVAPDAGEQRRVGAGSFKRITGRTGWKRTLANDRNRKPFQVSEMVTRGTRATRSSG